MSRGQGRSKKKRSSLDTIGSAMILILRVNVSSELNQMLVAKTQLRHVAPMVSMQLQSLTLTAHLNLRCPGRT